MPFLLPNQQCQSTEGEPRGLKSCMRRNTTPRPIWIKFGVVVDIPDVVTCTNFGDNRLRSFWVAGGQIYPFPIVFSSSHNTLTVPWECVKHRNFSNGLWKALSTEANKNIFHCCPFVLSFGPQVAVAIIWFCLLSSVKLSSIIFGCNTSVTHLTINLKYWLQVKRDRYRRFLVISMLLVTCFGCLSFFIPC